MKILVTGSAGFIGFHVSKSLLERGDEVIGVDNFNSAYDPQVKEDRNKILEENSKYKVCRVDISDYEGLKKVFLENKPDKICHLAAMAGVLPSLKDPFIYEKVNILGTLNIFHLAKEVGVNQVVYASSSSVYGANKKTTSSEEDNVDNPISLYAVTKKTDELMANCYHHLFGIKMTGLRFFNVYGEWGRPDMMPWIFTENILLGKKINVNNHGDTWKDYTYIADIATGVLAAIDNPQDYEVVNLGNHKPIHLKRCIELIEKETGKKAIMEMRPMQPGDVQRSCAENTKAKEMFGWEPTTDIEVGMPKFIRWYGDYKGLSDGN